MWIVAFIYRYLYNETRESWLCAPVVKPSRQPIDLINKNEVTRETG